MSLYRFYIPDLLLQLAAGSMEAALADEEAHHARTVLRLAAGTSVVVFDGKGGWSPAQVVDVAKRGVRVRLAGAPLHAAPPPIQLTLCTAVPKGERADWLVEQASQLNVAAIQWLDCAHSVVRPREGGGKMDKWRRLAVESAKQCGRHYLMEIAGPVAAVAPLSAAAARQPATEARFLWLDPDPAGRTIPQALANFSAGTVTAFIGPEGGWSDEERQWLERLSAAGKLHRVRLTATVLRIETACAAVAAVVGAGMAAQTA